MPSRRKRSMVTLAALAALTTCGVATAQELPVTKPSAFNPPGDAERGAEIGAVCLSCHGDPAPLAATSSVPPPRLLHQRSSAIFYALLDYRDGKRKSDVMAPFVSMLSEQDMRDIAVYLAGPDIALPPKPHLSGTEIHAFTVRNCSLCHGETGMGEMEGMPIITGQDPQYLKHALAEYRNGGRTDPTMSAVAKSLDPDMDAAIADYFANHKALEPSK